MAHGGHGHHHHDHSKMDTGDQGQSVSRIQLAFWLNLLFAVVELVGGIWTNSVAILSDAVHDFGDALAIGSALFLERKSQGKSNERFSYGYRRFSTLSAMLTGLILVAGSVWILAQSIPRLLKPEQPRLDGMIGIALLGVAVNGFAALRLSKGKSLNEKVITWHLLEDLAGWVLVLVGAITMVFWELPIIDPILGILLSMFILWNVVKNLKETMKVFLQATPTGIEVAKIEDYLRSFSRVQGCHHTHVWSIDGETHILTTHLVVEPQTSMTDQLKLKALIKAGLKERHQIFEATIEIEISGDPCFDPSHA